MIFADATSAYTISGSVKNVSTSQGIPDATVTIRNGSDAVAATSSTDQEGNFIITITIAGDYYAFAVKKGYEDLSPPSYPIEISDANTDVIFNILLTPAGPPLTSVILELAPGWNFISFPRDPSPNNSVTAILQEVSHNVRIVWGYNNKTKGWLKYKPVTGETLTSMSSGAGYWIYMDASGAITMTNWANPSATMTLNSGWNLVGYNGNNSTDISTALNSISGNYSIIWNWSKGDWLAHSANNKLLPIPDFTTLDQKKAYWIYAKVEGITWNLSFSNTSSPIPSFTITQSISDEAQRTTLAFSGLAMMHFQDPSLLEFQRRLQCRKHTNNLTAMFSIDSIPEDTQMRDIMDEVDSKEIEPIFTDFFRLLQRGKLQGI